MSRKWGQASGAAVLSIVIGISLNKISRRGSRRLEWLRPLCALPQCRWIMRKLIALAQSGLVTVLVLAAIAPARAVDEIQVYNAEIAKVGEWTVQQHLNYAI